MITTATITDLPKTFWIDCPFVINFGKLLGSYTYYYSGPVSIFKFKFGNDCEFFIRMVFPVNDIHAFSYKGDYNFNVELNYYGKASIVFSFVLLRQILNNLSEVV